MKFFSIRVKVLPVLSCTFNSEVKSICTGTPINLGINCALGTKRNGPNVVITITWVEAIAPFWDETLRVSPGKSGANTFPGTTVTCEIVRFTFVLAAIVWDTVSTTVFDAYFQNAEKNLPVGIDWIQRLESGPLAKPKPGSVISNVSLTSISMPGVNEKTRAIASMLIEELVVAEVSTIEDVRWVDLNVPNTLEKAAEFLRTIEVEPVSTVFEKHTLLEFFLKSRAVVGEGVREDLETGAVAKVVVATDWTEYLNKESTGGNP